MVRMTEQEMEEQELIELVDDLSVQELRAMTPDVLRSLMSEIQFPVNIQAFLFAKNIKILGGINEYIDDFLPHMDRLVANPAMNRMGAISILRRMLHHPDISEHYRGRVHAALDRLMSSAHSGKRNRPEWY